MDPETARSTPGAMQEVKNLEDPEYSPAPEFVGSAVVLHHLCITLTPPPCGWLIDMQLCRISVLHAAM